MKYIFTVIVLLLIFSCKSNKEINITIKDVPAILHLSKKYNEHNDNNNLVIYIPGNNQQYTKKTSDKSMDWLMDNNYSFASI